MIECPKCGLYFSPAVAICPGCNGYDTPNDVRMNYVQREVINSVQDGVLGSTEARQQLVDIGFEDQEADRIVRSAQKSASRDNRKAGVLRLVLGVALLGIALGGFAAAFVGLRANVRFSKILFFAAGGIVFSIIGLAAIFSGLFAVSTGRESGVALPSLDHRGRRIT